jgi:hypothetical protein
MAFEKGPTKYSGLLKSGAINKTDLEVLLEDLILNHSSKGTSHSQKQTHQESDYSYVSEGEYNAMSIAALKVAIVNAGGKRQLDALLSSKGTLEKSQLIELLKTLTRNTDYSYVPEEGYSNMSIAALKTAIIAAGGKDKLDKLLKAGGVDKFQLIDLLESLGSSRKPSPPKPKPRPKSRSPSPKPRPRPRSPSPKPKPRSPPKPKPNASCPSRGKTPQHCTTKKEYFKQARIFHPNNNLGCTEEAKEKFQLLNNMWDEFNNPQPPGFFGGIRYRNKSRRMKKNRRETRKQFF